MNKSTNFSGIPVIKQIIKIIDKGMINRTARKYNADRYYKKFDTFTHLVTMLYAVLSGCNSLREIEGISLACQGRLQHLGAKCFPKRSTLADANKNRCSKVFASIYFSLYNQFKGILADSRMVITAVKNLNIIDSTTITLFSELLRGAGRNPKHGKRKGGIKVHTMINAMEDVPCVINITSSATCDKTFLKDINLKKGSFIVFDKGYNNFEKFRQWDNEGVYFVTRQHENAAYDSIHEFDIEDSTDAAILKDEEIKIGKTSTSFIVRRIAFWDEKYKRVLVFITNNFDLSPETIANIYKNRWQIESLFKRLKQNFPLKYFLGDNRNAIEIQVWISLIAHLLMLVLKAMVKDRKWAFSNMVSVIRYHLMSYIDILKFLNNPDDSWHNLKTKDDGQLTLFG